MLDYLESKISKIDIQTHFLVITKPAYSAARLQIKISTKIPCAHKYVNLPC